MTKMTLRELYNYGKEVLSKAQYGEAHIDAKILLLHCFKTTPEYFYTYGRESTPDLPSIEQYKEMLKLRASRMPVAYITGKKEFMGLNFIVNQGTLIPRPCTEILVEKAMEIIDLSGWENPRAADVGCGSGNIALSLAFHRRNVRVFASDLSIDALRIARLNINKLDKEFPPKNLFYRIHLLPGDLMEPFPPQHKGTYNLVLSNPPYVTKEEWENLMDGVKLFEPEMALCPPYPPETMYEKLLSQARDFLSIKGWVIVEIGASQQNMIKRVFEETGYKNFFLLNDLEGFPRVAGGCKEA